MKNLLDTYPNKERAILLKREMDLSLLGTMKYLISVASKNYPESFENQNQFILDTENKVSSNEISLNSSHYILNCSLQNEMKSGNSIKVKELLNYILELKPRQSADTSYSELKKGAESNFINNCFVDIFTKEFREASNVNFFYNNCTSYEFSKQASKTALESLEQIDKELYSEISIYLSDILILNSEQINAGSSFFTFGLVYLKELTQNQHWIILLEHIVHECAHLHLYTLWKKDPIVINDKEELFKSPLRKDLRPMSGIFHAMFVLSRLIYLEAKVSNHPIYKDIMPFWTKINNNARNNAPLKDKFYDSFNTILEFGKLTEIGKEVLLNCKNMVDETKVTVANNV